VCEQEEDCLSGAKCGPARVELSSRKMNFEDGRQRSTGLDEYRQDETEVWRLCSAQPGRSVKRVEKRRKERSGMRRMENGDRDRQKLGNETRKSG
jgi:hypothetical protein